MIIIKHSRIPMIMIISIFNTGCASFFSQASESTQYTYLNLILKIFLILSKLLNKKISRKNPQISKVDLKLPNK